MSDAILQVVDIGLVVVANLVNLLNTALFLARVWGRHRLESALGLVMLAMGLPAGAVAVVNLLAARPLWAVVMPALLVVYCALELVLDYILRLDWRHTRLLGPYLAVYYAALMALIGYAFLVGLPWGFITLGTYFILLLATWYSHRGGRARGGSTI